MSAPTPEPAAERTSRYPVEALEQFSRAVLTAIGASAETADAATRAMSHGSLLGIDSHGFRLLDHYVKALVGGRVNRSPKMRFLRGGVAVATLDADNAHGALATYQAMDKAVELAGQAGLGAVAIRNSSHFGPAGAYALAAAEAGLIGVTTCNADSFVRLHDGAARFHGTNPLAFAVPVEGQSPWLLDMATSAIPYNRVQLYKSLGRPLPHGTASDANGLNTRDPEEAEMLAPLGGEFGFKGAGLAGVAEILSAVATGMRLSFDIEPMGGPDFKRPRGLGAFVMALRPDAFVSQEVFQRSMRRYVHSLRSSPARPGHRVMAPGDREWREADERRRHGVPIDPVTRTAFRSLAERYRIRPLPES